MLTKIELKELRIGMLLERVDGSWLSHTLWRQRFLIDCEPTRSDVRQCGAVRGWIDTHKGIAIKHPGEVKEPAQREFSTTQISPADALPPSRESTTRAMEAQRPERRGELGQASCICSDAEDPDGAERFEGLDELWLGR